MPPEEIGELKQLQELSLDHNQLTILPSSLFRLVHLTYLNISYNPLGTTTTIVNNNNYNNNLIIIINKVSIL